MELDGTLLVVLSIQKKKPQNNKGVNVNTKKC